MISRLLRGERGIGLEPVLAIARESADWEHGPIRPEEWALPSVGRGKGPCQVPRPTPKAAPRKGARKGSRRKSRAA